MQRFYPIGTPGEPWGDQERAAWLRDRSVQRSYAADVIERLRALPDGLELQPYGALSFDAERYPLLAVRLGPAERDLPWALVTGGVHGYETSGVHGALAFLSESAAEYRGKLNLLVAPCVSPWGYEVINRWNPQAVDPNRSFRAPSPSEEAAALMALVAAVPGDFLVHIDLHETTESDEQEFRPAVAARDGKPFTPGLIPDGFYLVDDTENPRPAFQAAIIAAVDQVTHIAPADAEGQIIGCDVVQRGVIRYPVESLGLCAGVTKARFTTTTEVYPDSPSATPELCIAAQLAAVRAGLDHALAHPA